MARALSGRQGRQADPADHRQRRALGHRDHPVYDGEPWTFALSIDQFRGDRIARQIIYVFDGWDAPEWRAPWGTLFNPHASIEPAEYVDGEPFGLEADLTRTVAER